MKFMVALSPGKSMGGRHQGNPTNMLCSLRPVKKILRYVPWVYVQLSPLHHITINDVVFRHTGLIISQLRTGISLLFLQDEGL
jgi:hypothetical protein